MPGADAQTREGREVVKDERCSKCKAAAEQDWNGVFRGDVAAVEGDEDERRRRRKEVGGGDGGDDMDVDANGEEKVKWVRRLSQRLKRGRSVKVTEEKSERSEGRLGRLKQRAVGVTRTLRGEGAMVRA